MEDLFVDAGPPLFPPEVKAVDEVAGEPLLPDLGPGLVLLRIVEGGETSGCAGADDLREVDGRISVVFARDDDAGDGVPRTFAEAAVA